MFDTIYLQLAPVEVAPGTTSCVVQEMPDSGLPFPSRWKQAIELVPALGEAHAITLVEWRYTTRHTMSDRTFWRMKKAAVIRGVVTEVDGKVFRGKASSSS